MAASIALVTGASRGIGEAIARRLAKDGFDIALNDLPSQASALERLHKEITAGGRHAYIHTGDVSKDFEVKDMVDSTVKTLGGLDVMVANAGIARFTSLLDDNAINIWDQTMSINARGVFLCYKYAAEVMVAQGKGGRIIGASSRAGKQGVENAAAYSASKFVVRSLTQTAARELGKHGITVNAYAPGPIDTAIWDTLGFDEVTLGSLRDSEIAKTVVGRIGKPEDVANLVSYLASPESGFTTGQTISIDGGQFFD